MDFKKELKPLILDVVIRGQVRLSSGKISDFYIDGRKVSLTSKGAFCIGNLILDIMDALGLSVISGLTLGADPIISAVLCCAGMKGIDIKGLIVRKERKSHGQGRQIEGPEIEKKEEVLLVDDVATTGSSILKATEVLRSEGYRVSKAVVMVDRQEGAKERLAQFGIELLPIFTKEELL